ncbi:hypothetical protein ACMXYV_06630 [Neptuniibacter sp. SY11_33]|uniref:hypothetical protein n=1 Tax=Neptuniibacter sp. SY11_33 TaxID=3398215 RepID=UPI0039F599EC
MSEKLREQLIELAVHSVILFFQSWAYYIIYIYVRYGGIFRDKSNNASIVEPSDPLFTVALLVLTPFIAITIFRFLRSICRLLKTAALTVFAAK